MSALNLAFVGDWLPKEPLHCQDLFGPDTLVVGNLECVFADLLTRNSKAYSVVLPRTAMKNVAGSGFAALSLANNHVYDAGVANFGAMVEALQQLEAPQFYGLRDQPYATLDVKGLRVALVGGLERCRSRGPRIFPLEEIADLIASIRSAYDRVFVTPHWGKESEYANHPSPQQCRLAEKWIGAGADGVVGHHAHVIQGKTVFQRRPVYFSVGNFMFDHEEGMRYPLTSYGLSALWTPRAGKRQDLWDHSFLENTPNGVNPPTQDKEQLLKTYLEAISEDILREEAPWSRDLWARAVGPIYIEKSTRSWKLRFRASPLRTLPAWIVWNLLPTTRAMKAGCRAPLRSALARRRELEDALAEHPTPFDKSPRKMD